MQGLSLTQQAHNWLLNIIPTDTDEFSVKYPIRALTYDYTTAIATATLDPASIVALQAEGFTDPNTQILTSYANFTITDCKTQYNIVNAVFDNGLRFIVTFDKPIFIQVYKSITLEGFLPVDFNVTCRVLEQIDAVTFALDMPNVTNLYILSITTLGYYNSSTQYRGFNGLKTFLSIDSVTNTVTYPTDPQNIIATSASVYDLGGSYGMGCGFIHDWHNNIHIGNHTTKITDYNNINTNHLFVVSNDFSIRANQEKSNTLDVSDRQDSRQGNIQRFIKTFYIDYILNSTDFALASANEAKVANIFNILYKLSGMPYYEVNIANNTMPVLSYFSLGSVTPLRSETSLLPIYRFEFNIVSTYGTPQLGDTGFETFALNTISATAIPQNNNFIINT